MDNDGIHAASIDNEENNTEKNLHEESDLSAIAETASGTATEEQQMQVPSNEEENDRRSRFIMLQKPVKTLCSEIIYEKCTLLQAMPDLKYFEHQVTRPKGTTFRVGDEVFICHGARKETAGVQFLFYGISWNSTGYKYCSAILHQPQQSSTRTVPLLYLGHKPNGKFAQDNTETVHSCDQEINKWFVEIKKQPKAFVILRLFIPFR